MHLRKKQSTISGRRVRAVNRVRAKILGTSLRPRLAVFRSLTAISAQLIDDNAQSTILGVYGHELPGKNKKMNKTETAQALGELLGKKAKEKKIERVVFDRRWYKYHGRVKAFAEGARKEGLKF